VKHRDNGVSRRGSANALFVESDCTGSCGRVTQPTTSIGEMASLVNIAPRPTDWNLLPVRSRLRCRVVGPVLAHNFRVADNRGVRDCSNRVSLEALQESRNRFHESEIALFSCKGQADVFSTNSKPYRCQGVPEDSFRTARACPT